MPRTPRTPLSAPERLLGALSAPAFTVALVWLLSATFVGFESAGQEMIRFSSDSSLMIREIGAILETGDDGLNVAIVMPAEARAEGYGDVDVRRGDLVLMINGRRVREIEVAREILGGAGIGDEIALGIRRGGDSVIARFALADPDSLPERLVFDGSGGGPGDGHGVAVERRMMFQGEGELTPLLALGVILQTVEEDGVEVLKIGGILPHMATAFEEGDVLKTVAGDAIESAQWLVDQVESADAGTVFEFTVERGDETVDVEQAKSDVQGEIRLGAG